MWRRAEQAGPGKHMMTGTSAPRGLSTPLRLPSKHVIHVSSLVYLLLPFAVRPESFQSLSLWTSNTLAQRTTSSIHRDRMAAEQKDFTKRKLWGYVDLSIPLQRSALIDFCSLSDAYFL